MIKMKLYKEIGMPPVPVKDEKQNGDIEPTRQLKTLDKRELVTIEPKDSDLEFNKQLGLWRRRRPKTPAAQARATSLKPRRPISAKRESLHEPKDEKKLIPQFNIKAVKQFNSDSASSIHDYDFIKKIGKGAYAVVKLAVHLPSSEKRAVKLYDRSKLIDGTRKQSLIKEIKILKKIDHPNIIKFYESIDTAKYVYLSTEFVPGPSLLQHLKSKPNRCLHDYEIKCLWKQLIQAIAYLHSLNITHRDVKLENILLSEDLKEIKLIDFGFSTICPTYKKLKIYCGTPSYMAPQIVKKREYYGPPTDIWACGVLLFTMFCGRFPFKGRDDRDLYRRIQKGNYSVPDHVPHGAQLLLSKLLEVDVSKRLTATEILEDPWLN